MLAHHHLAYFRATISLTAPPSASVLTISFQPRSEESGDAGQGRVATLSAYLVIDLRCSQLPCRLDPSRTRAGMWWSTAELSSRNEHRAFEPPASSELSVCQRPGHESGPVCLAHAWLGRSMLIAMRVRSNCCGGWRIMRARSGCREA